MNWCRVALHVNETDSVSLHIGGDNSESLHIGADIYSVETQPYEESYEVTPTMGEQVLPTRSKTMRDDVTVHAIPYTQTTNESGGYTAIIAAS